MNPPNPIPRLRLFLSADIVNSTAFKQRSESEDDLPHPWLSTYNDFFYSIQNDLAFEYEKLREQKEIEESLIGHCPRFWKAAGDEIILVQHITQPDQPYIAISLFLKVINRIRKNVRGAGTGLDVKLTAWLAGFPINNAEFVIGSDRNEDFTGSDDYDYSHYVYLEKHYDNELDETIQFAENLDFIGPQMDLGFRLASLATPRKLIMSIDLAWMLAKTALEKTGQMAEYFDIRQRFKFDGTQSLKGVLSGIPYPIFWFDVLPDQLLNIKEDVVSGRTSVGLTSVVCYIEEFINHHSNQKTGSSHDSDNGENENISENAERNLWLCKPFVCKPEDGIEDLPESHRMRLEYLREELQKKYKMYNEEEEELKSEGADSTGSLQEQKVKESIELIAEPHIAVNIKDREGD